MSVIQTWFGQDLQKAVKVNHIDGNLFSHNGNGNSIGVRVYNDGEPVTLTGTVSGYVITSDGSTVPCVGARSGNEATITIPPAAYQPGNAFITIFLTDGSTVTTLCAAQTTVLQARTGSQVSPGSVVQDWTQTINAAMQSVEDAAENLGGIIATPYASLTYPVPLGKYTYYNSNLYRCISPIETSEEFTAAHWTQVKLGDDVSALKSAIDNLLTIPYTVINDKGFNRTYGTFPDEQGWDITDFIPVNAGETIYVYCMQRAGSYNGFYKADKTYIGDFSIALDSFQAITVPAEAAYMVVSNAHNKWDYVLYRNVNEFVLKDVFTRQNSFVAGQIAEIRNDFNDIDNGDVTPTFTDGIFINYSTGAEGSEGGYSSTGEIEIIQGFSYALTTRVTSSVVGYAFYNSSHTYISGGSLETSESGVETFTAKAPNGAKYLRFSTVKTYKDKTSYKILLYPTVEDKFIEEDTYKVDSRTLEQTFGQGANKVMSQKAVSDLLGITVTNKTKELIAYSTVVDGKYCNPANGNISDVASYQTATLSLENVTNIFDSYSNRSILNYDSIVFFDSLDNYISGYQPELSSQSDQVEYNGAYGVYFNIPATAKKAVINLIKNRNDQRYAIIFYNEASATIPIYEEGNPLKGKTITNFGDSIFGNYRDTNDSSDKSISKMIADATGATVYNAGFGGCRMATAYRYWDAFSMHSLADSIALTKTSPATAWTVQENAITESDAEPETGTSKLLDYFPTTLAMLKEIDFSIVDYITIGYGTNDYTGNIDISSFSDALKYSINKILTAYPRIRVVVISPCWRWWASGGVYSYSSDDAQSENTHGDKLTAYVSACEDVSKEYHVPFIDTYNTLGFNQFTATTYFTGTDGTHPNQYGRQLRADRIVGQMNSLY